MRQKNTIHKQVFIVIAISTLIRLILASLLELGNDEVYYWTYALYPDASHFDHPPMVGFLIQASTLNLRLADDFFLRLGPIVLAAFNTWIIFLIGAKIKDERTGLFASLLFTSSIYCSLIAGFAIIPDAPQVFFWLLSLYLMLDFLPASIITHDHRIRFILFSICAGLAMLSKYHSAFLWIGAMGYILFYNRKWLSDYSLYISLALSFIIITPIIYWNVKHDFISFTFHGNRVTTAFQFRPDYFLREIGGQIAYNNPVNYVLIIIALIGLLQKKIAIDNSIRILLLTSLPLYFTFTGFSLFRSTLPHWTGPSFISLIIIAAIYWSARLHSKEGFTIPTLIILPSYFLVLLLCAAVYIINYSPLQLGKRDTRNLGNGDFTQDLYGWQQIGEEFKKIATREEERGTMQKNADLISYRWFPGAHEDFYMASLMHRNLYLIGELNDTHKYYWINEQRGGLTTGKDYYHIAVTNYYRDPNIIFGSEFEKITVLDTINVLRMNTLMRQAYVYKLENYKGKP
jgi:hypothetical protein